MREDRPLPNWGNAGGRKVTPWFWALVLAVCFVLGLSVGLARRQGSEAVSPARVPAEIGARGDGVEPDLAGKNTVAMSEPGVAGGSSEPDAASRDLARDLERLDKVLGAVVGDEHTAYLGAPWRQARLLLEVERRMEPGMALPLAREYIRRIEQNTAPKNPLLLGKILFFLAAEQDPVEAARLAWGFPRNGYLSKATQSGVLEALKAAPESAGTREALSLLEPWQREEWLRELEMAKLEDPEARVRLLLEGSPERSHQLAEQFEHLARLDPERAFTLYVDLNGNLQDFLQNELEKGLPEMEFEKAWALAGELELGNTRAGIENRLLLTLARRDLDAAVQKLEKLTLQPSHLGLHHWIGAMLVRQDPQRAMAWAERLPPGRERMNLMSGIAKNAAPHPEETLQWIEDLPDATERRRVLSTALAVIARENPRIAWEWIAARPEMLERKAVFLDDMFNVWARNDAVSAMRFFQEINPPHGRAYAIREIMRDLADQNPRATREFFEYLEDPREKREAAQAAAYTLARNNLPEAARWADEMEPGEPRDQLVREIASELQSYDLEGAITWAGTMHDPALRQTLQTRYAEEWIKRDPAAAKQWLEKGHLPDGRTRKLVDEAHEAMNQREEARR